MTDNPNVQSPFAKALNEAVNASANAEKKGAALIVAMCSSNDFHMSACVDFFRAVQNRQGTEKLEKILKEYSPAYEEAFYMRENSSSKGIQDEKEKEKLDNRKLEATQTCRKYEMLLRDAFVAVYYLRRVEATDIKLVKGKIVYDVAKRDADNHVIEGKFVEREENPASLRKYGSKVLDQDGLKKAPRSTTTETPTYAIEQIKKEGFGQLVAALVGILRNKDISTLSESEAIAPSNLEEVLLSKVYPGKGGTVNIGKLIETYSPVDIDEDEQKAA